MAGQSVSAAKIRAAMGSVAAVTAAQQRQAGKGTAPVAKRPTGVPSSITGKR